MILLFDKLASKYDEWYKTPLGALCDALEKNAVFSLANVKDGEPALDVSCGTGNYTLELARNRARVYGIDLSKEMLRIVKTKVKEANLDVNLQRATAEKLPFTDASFSLITCVLMLEFTKSPENVIKEMFRVLKPKGRMVIGVLNKFSLWALIRRMKAFASNSIWRNATFFDRRTIMKMLSTECCTKLECKTAIYFPPINHKWLLNRFRIFERIGQVFFPDFCAFFCVKCER